MSSNPVENTPEKELPRSEDIAPPLIVLGTNGIPALKGLENLGLSSDGSSACGHDGCF